MGQLREYSMRLFDSDSRVSSGKNHMNGMANYSPPAWKLAAGLTARHATTTADNLYLSLAAKRFPSDRCNYKICSIVRTQSRIQVAIKKQKKA
jgi:hypothetical protein